LVVTTESLAYAFVPSFVGEAAHPRREANVSAKKTVANQLSVFIEMLLYVG
jgi:hypothetical protein